MTCTPTEQELIEMGFKTFTDGYAWRSEKVTDMSAWIAFKPEWSHSWLVVGRRFYPSSKSDIETLIRLFTK